MTYDVINKKVNFCLNIYASGVENGQVIATLSDADFIPADTKSYNSMCVQTVNGAEVIAPCTLMIDATGKISVNAIKYDANMSYGGFCGQYQVD